MRANIEEISTNVRNARYGKLHAFECLYFLTYEIVYTSIRTKLNCDEIIASEEIFHKSYMIAFTNIHSLKNDNHFERWILSIARSLCISYLHDEIGDSDNKKIIKGD